MLHGFGQSDKNSPPRMSKVTSVSKPVSPPVVSNKPRTIDEFEWSSFTYNSVEEKAFWDKLPEFSYEILELLEVKNIHRHSQMQSASLFLYPVN